jgi:hypothetical protein
MHQNALLALDANDSDLCNYGWRLASGHPATAVRFARGSKMRIASGLFDEIAAACQFPYYFGENWPAFAECLGDMSWLNSSRFVLIITHFEEVLADEKFEMSALGRALRTAISAYNDERKNPDSNDSLFQILIQSKLDDKQLNDPRTAGIGSPLALQI